VAFFVVRSLSNVGSKMARPQFGPLPPPHVDPVAAEARRELLSALAVAYPRTGGSYTTSTEGDARQELRSALQAAFPSRDERSFASRDECGVSIVEVDSGLEAQTTDTRTPSNEEAEDNPVGQTRAEIATDTADPPLATAGGSDKAEDTDQPDKIQEGLERLTYLSRQPSEARVAWCIQKGEQLRRDGNKLYGQGDWRAASVKYRSVLDLLGDREQMPENVRKTHDDLFVLCGSNLAACALKADDAEEALKLCKQVLAIDPAHSKARFRHALALVRRTRAPPPPPSPGAGLQTAWAGPPPAVVAATAAVEAVEDEASGPRWAAPRAFLPGSMQQARGQEHSIPSGAAAEGVGEEQQPQGRGHRVRRAMDLLEAQGELEAICRLSPRDRMVRDSVEELFARAKHEGVHLRPPPWLFPKALRRFDYRHGKAPAEEAEATTAGVTAIAPPAPAQGASVAIAAAAAAADDGGTGGPGTERNLIIFLHGFGGRRDRFVALAETLQLPKSATMSFDGPLELSEELLDDPPGYSWFTMLDDDFEFIEPRQGEGRRLASLDRSAALLAESLYTLVGMCNWALPEIFLFGYGQGGTVALDLLFNPGPCRGLGGVVGIATEVLPERLWNRRASNAREPSEPAKAPSVLLIHGALDACTRVTAAEASAEGLRKALSLGGLQGLGEEHVRLRIFPERRGEMLRGEDPDETRCLMEFFSDNLHGLGRHGSEEAVARLGAEPVRAVELCGLD